MIFVHLSSACITLKRSIPLLSMMRTVSSLLYTYSGSLTAVRGFGVMDIMLFVRGYEGLGSAEGALVHVLFSPHTTVRFFPLSQMI